MEKAAMKIYQYKGVTQPENHKELMLVLKKNYKKLKYIKSELSTVVNDRPEKKY